ncbi:MAG: hypothetical protein OZSIB_2934 [Candidatus Ozemobacter sibiricus]|uniref:Uncharacterized protein n=1 Tax=Candidatus Ozemobacter sibiricus TaxID=2268124 RepID=A0A367ZTE9_9BACT|nr:MAG: hypothetical protein OZSIB_2934 [Candidatus Ozemobacter sibiricus]
MHDGLLFRNVETVPVSLYPFGPGKTMSPRGPDERWDGC